MLIPGVRAMDRTPSNTPASSLAIGPDSVLAGRFSKSRCPARTGPRVAWAVNRGGVVCCRAPVGSPRRRRGVLDTAGAGTIRPRAERRSVVTGRRPRRGFGPISPTRSPHPGHRRHRKRPARLTTRRRVGQQRAADQRRSGPAATECRTAAASAAGRSGPAGPTAGRTIDAWAAEDVPATALRPGDVIEVRAGEVVPADALIEEDNVEVDESRLTGSRCRFPSRRIRRRGLPWRNAPA